MNTDEILENLRLRAHWATQELITTLMTEAANEIERLRALADELHQRGMLQLKCTDKAWEAYAEVEADRDRWRDLAEYLCQNAGSVVVPEWIASRFPDPLAVRGE